MAVSFWSIAAIVVPAAVSFGAFWLFFYMPLGRRRTVVVRTISASTDDVWRLADPRNLNFSWNPHWEQRDVRKVADEPLTVEYLARPRGSNGEFTPRREIWSRIIPGSGLTSYDTKADNSGAGGPVESCEHLDLLETSKGEVRVVLAAEGPLRGLFGYEMRRMALQKYLAALDAAARGQAAPRQPFIRFAGWRLAALAVLSIFVLINGSLFWKPFDGGAYFTAALVTATLVFAILLHELGHALALVLMGHRNVTISLIPFVGGVAASSRNYSDAFEAGVVAIAGVAFSTVVCLALLPALPYLENMMAGVMFSQGDEKAAIFAGLRQNPLPWVALCAFGVTAWQLIVNTFNMMPFPGSDGWRLLQSIFSSRVLLCAAAVCVCILFAAILGSSTVLFVLAVFWALSLLARWRSGKPAAADEMVCSKHQKLALATAFAFATLCLGFEFSVTQAFMSNAKSMVSRQQALEAQVGEQAQVEFTSAADKKWGLHKVLVQGI
jgi:Zn-dependent protease